MRTKPVFNNYALRLLPAILSAFVLQNAIGQPANEPLENFVVTDGFVNSMAVNDHILYLGGQFTQAGVRTGGGVPISITTGLPEPIFPGVNGDVYIATGDGQGGWFIGGLFSVVGGYLRTNLVHIRSDRSVDPNWTPSANGGWVDCLISSGNTLYLGGSFTNVNGQARNRLAALDKTSGALINNWNPNASGSIRAMILYNTNIYVGGEFTSLGGQTRNRIGAVDSTSGALTSWNPNANDWVYAMVVSGGHLYVGGYSER
jgi:hypothetical protein